MGERHEIDKAHYHLTQRTIDELRAELAQRTMERDHANDWNAELEAELATMAAVLKSCLEAVEFDDSRVRYITVQVTRPDLDEARELIAKWLPKDKLRNVGLPKEVRDE